VVVEVAVPRLVPAEWQVLGIRSRHPIRKGTANMDDHKTRTRRVGTSGRATPKKARRDPAEAVREAALVLLERVSVAVGELVAELEEGVLALVVRTGLQVVQTMMEAEVDTLAGPKGRHDLARRAVRHGCDDGQVSLGGQVTISRPRVRSADGPGRCHSPPTTA